MEFHKQSWKERGRQRGKLLAKEQVQRWDWFWHQVQEGPARRKGFRLSQATSLSPDFLKRHSASPSVPFLANPKLTRGLGDGVPRSPGDSAASAILALLLRSLPQACAEPETRRPRPVSASSDRSCVTERRPAATGGSGRSLSSGSWGRIRVADLPLVYSGRHAALLTLSNVPHIVLSVSG